MKNTSNSFEILGLDITFDENYSPYLLEYNRNPWLTVDRSMLIAEPISNAIHIYNSLVIYGMDAKYKN